MEPFAVKRTGDEDYPKHIKALVQGPPKSGKTSLLATFPNPIIADVEWHQGGLQSVAHLDIPHITVDHSSKLDTLHMMLKDDQLRAKLAADVGRPSIDTVAIDTLDSLQELKKKERLADERRQTFQRDDWGWLLEQFQEMVRAFTSLPMHVVFTVHTKTVQDDEGRLVNSPALQGAIQDQIAGMVGYSLLSMRTVEIDQQTGQKYSNYTIQTEGDERNPHLGNRAAGRLPRVMRPHFDDLHDAAFGALQQMPQRQTVEVQTSVETDNAPAPADATEPPPQEPQAVAQSPGQPEATQTAAEAVQEQQQAAGQPRDDSDDPISPAALQHLTKMAGEFGYDINPEVKGWTLGQARDVAKYVVSCKTDAANGQMDDLKGEVTKGLIGMGAISATESGEGVPTGNVDDVVKWASQSTERARAAYAHEVAKGDDGRSTLKNKLKSLVESGPSESGQASEQAPEQSTESAPEPQGQPEAQKVDDQGSTEPEAQPAEAPEAPQEEQPEPPSPEEAEELIKSELGGEEIPAGELPEDQRPCEVCGKSKASAPDDFDLDIARLSEVRFKQWLCVNDYMSKVQEKKAAS